MAKRPLTYDDAKLTLKLYELRREATMRQARDIVNAKFWPENYQDVQAVLLPGHPFNAALRQTVSYWEMVYGMARHGIIDADYLMENNGEGLVLFSKILPYLDQLRRDYADTLAQNAEWITQNCEIGKKALARIQTRMARLRESMKASKAASEQG